MAASLAGLGADAASLEEICRRWGIATIWLFGSFARQQARHDSDLDLMLRFLPGRVPSLWNFVELKHELEALFSRDVDLVVEGSIRNPFRRRSIERDLTVIYAA
jgi:uncharacterized protein